MFLVADMTSRHDSARKPKDQQCHAQTKAISELLAKLRSEVVFDYMFDVRFEFLLFVFAILHLLLQNLNVYGLVCSVPG